MGNMRVIAAGAGDGRIHLICTQTGAKFFCLEGHSDFVRCVQFSTDAKQLVSGSDDKTVRLWDVGSGKQLKQFRGQWAQVNLSPQVSILRRQNRSSNGCAYALSPLSGGET